MGSSLTSGTTATVGATRANLEPKLRRFRRFLPISGKYIGFLRSDDALILQGVEGVVGRAGSFLPSDARRVIVGIFAFKFGLLQF
jgi:hypothetical protein